MRGALAALCALGLAVGCVGIAPKSHRAASDGVPPWDLPPSTLLTQRLYRMSYSGPRGGGSFRLTLRLESAVRYRAEAVDPLGRGLWSLDVDGDLGWFSDQRAGTVCKLEREVRIAGAPLDRIALGRLPALLLGRVPAVLAGGGDPAGVRAGSLTDLAGDRWRFRLEGGIPVRWRLERGGAPVAWWQRLGGEAILSDRSGAQLRWRETVAEPTPGRLGPLAEPPDAPRVPCAGIALEEG